MMTNRTAGEGFGRKLAPRDSLARGVPDSTPGTLFATSISGGITVGPNNGRTILFGRNRDDVHVCIGETDQRVSRQHGRLTCQDSQWWVHNTGQAPIRLPGAQLLLREEEPLPVAIGYTPLFIRGSHGREHLLELYVAGDEGGRPGPRYLDPTIPPKPWPLSDRERLALVALGQRYLLHDRFPQPLAWSQAEGLLREVQPTAGWTNKVVAHLVEAVRLRLSRAGVPMLTREEVGEPVGNTLNHNLLQELMSSTTLVPTDLVLLDPQPY
jgi:hypothetical protein